MKINQLTFLIIATIFSACNVGVNKDLLTGLNMTNNGLSYDKAYLAMDSTKLSSNVFPTGKVIFLYIEGVEGYTLKDDKVFIGASLDIFDENGNKIMDNPDLFASYDETGFALVNAKYLNLNLTIGSPMEAGKKYTWKSKIWDKNGKGIITAEIAFSVE